MKIEFDGVAGTGVGALGLDDEGAFCEGLLDVEVFDRRSGVAIAGDVVLGNGETDSAVIDSEWAWYCRNDWSDGSVRTCYSCKKTLCG